MNKKNSIIILIIALFNFVFLTTEYFFDGLMAQATHSANVVNAQNIVLGASVLGFVGYHFIKEQDVKIFNAIALTVYIVSLVTMYINGAYTGILMAGVIGFIALGLFGAESIYQATKAEDKKHLASVLGIAYAIGIFFQFINNNCVKDELVQGIVIIVGAVLLVCIILFAELDNGCIESDKCAGDKNVVRTKAMTISIVGIIFMTVFMTVIFSTLDNAVTLVHSQGDYNIGQWPRLFLAISGLVAGFLYDIKNRKYMVYMMYIMTFISVISIVVIQLGGSFITGLIVFYIAAGFFVVFFMTGFVDLAHYSVRPKLWAGMGRAVNNLCALLTTAISVRLLADGNIMTIMVLAIIVFVALSICMFAYMNNYAEVKWYEGAEEIVVAVSKEKNLKLFSEEFKLTDREQEVLEALLESDRDVQETAKSLAISRTALYRHVSSMNEKTGTQSRMGLLRFYYKWIE